MTGRRVTPRVEIKRRVGRWCITVFASATVAVYKLVGDICSSLRSYRRLVDHIRDVAASSQRASTYQKIWELSQSM
jgi:hypothetical protein